MDAFVITGPTTLMGEVSISGAKNVALKAFVASLLTTDTVTLHNIPIIGDVLLMLDVLKHIGVEVEFINNTVTLRSPDSLIHTVSLEVGAKLRTSSLVVGPLLARTGMATIPNPGGCRIGARPIDRHILGLQKMGASITYDSTDGFFHVEAEKLHGADIIFDKNTHTGTETILLAAVLAEGKTTIQNAAEEIEVDDLINLLNMMGAKIQRKEKRVIEIEGVSSLHGTEYKILPDRNEEVTFAIAACLTDGSITVSSSTRSNLIHFYEVFSAVGGGIEEINETTTRYFRKFPISSIAIETRPHPGFMTDWQAPWAVLMTQANGISEIHETVFESRFSYVKELMRMGAVISFFDPKVSNPESFYNFRWHDQPEGYFQAIRIKGKTDLHNAYLAINDLRAGATLVLAAIAAKGVSYITGVQQIDRGYEAIDKRLSKLGANIKRINEGNI